MSFYYVYVLQSINTGRLYIGFTSDLKKRIKKHNSGIVKSTKAYSPYRLLYYEAFLNKTDALCQEKYLKSGRGKELVKEKLQNYFKS